MLNLKKLGQSIFNGLNPLDNGRGWTSAPVPMSQNQQAVAQNLQGATRGVLANPQARQQFVQGIAPSHFNPVTATVRSAVVAPVQVAQSTYNNVVKPLPGAFINTAKVPLNIGQLAATEITKGPNSPQAGAALQRLRNSYEGSIPNGMVTPAWHAVQAVEQTKLGNPLWYKYNQVKQAQKNQQAAEADAQSQAAIHQIQQGVKAGQIAPKDAGDAINQISQYNQAMSQRKEAGYQKAFVNAGFNPTDSPFTVGRKFVSNAGQTVANAATLGAATEAQPAEAALSRLANAANNSGKFMALSNTLGVAGQDQVKPLDLVKAPVTGYLQGALIGAALHPGDVVGAAKETAPKVSLATPEMRVNIGDQNILRDYTDMLVGSNKAKGKELSDLIGQTQQIGQKYGVDLTNGSRADRLDRAAGILNQIGQKNRDLTASGSIKNPFYQGLENPIPEDKLNELAKVNSGSQGNEAMQHGAAMNNYLFSKSPFSTPEDVAKAKVGMAKLEGTDQAAPTTMDKVIANTTGSTPEQVAAERVAKASKSKVALKAPNLNADMFSKENIAKYEKMNAQDLAAQSLPKTPVSEAPIKTATGKANEPYPANPIAPIKLPDVKNATEAIRVSESAASDFSQRVDLLAEQEDALVGKNLDARDKFIQAVENPRQASQIAKTFGGDSQTFLSLVKQHQDLANMEHAAQVGASNPRAYFGGEHGYFSHDVVFNNPADKAAYEALMTRTTKGRTALERTNPTLADLRANKLDIAPDSLGNATRKWGARQATILRDAALHDRLQSIDPNIQVVQAPGENPHFISSNSEFNKQLKGVQPYSTPTALKPLNAVNTGLKQVGLFGGGFHDLKTSIRSVTTDIASLRNPVSRLVEANKQFLSDGEHTKWNQARINEGYGKIFADADVAKTNIGLDLRSNIGKDLARGSVEKLNPYMTRLFGNKIDYFKKQLVIDEAKRNGITPDNYDPNNAAQIKIIRDAGDQAKNWFGGLNQRTLAKSPMFQQVLKYVTLAPDFTEGKIRSVGNVFVGGEKGSLARRQVIGEALGVAILAEAASKAMTGNYTSPVAAVINPSIPTNMKDKKGRPLAIGLPGSTVADVNRLVTDPSHFAISHSAAGPSTLISAVTGKDYFGDPLVDPFKNPNPNFGQNLAAALKSKGTIPGVQLSKTLSGKQSVATGIINTLGGRVGLDKNAPSYKETQAYFKAHDDFVKSLNPNDRSLLGVVEPVKKDTSGNSVTSKTFLNKPADFAQLQAHPDFLNKYTQYQRSQASHDPLWDLNPNQLNDYINVQKIKGTLPGTSSQFNNTDKAYLSSVEGSDWYRGLAAKRTTYFDKLVASGAIPKGTSTPDALTPASPDVQKVLDQIGTPGINTSYLLGSNPAAEQYLSAHADELNQRRADLGLPPLPKFPSPPSDSIRQKDLAYSQLPSGTGARSSYLKSNPDYMAYWQQKQDYYTALDGSSASTSSTYSTSQSNKTSGSSYASRSNSRKTSGGGSGSASYKAALADSTNPYKYAISRSAGGSAPKAKAAMKVGNLVKKSKVASAAGTKPKVSIKKALT